MAVVHLSPELPRLTVRGHKPVEETEPFDHFLSASYPSPTATEPPPLQRSYSGRPWSQSSDVSQLTAKTRKSLRGLGRSRVAAGMGGWIRSRQASGGSSADGPYRRASASNADEASTELIESAFNKIKEQLAKFSEEDALLKERVERLNEEICILQPPVEKLNDLQIFCEDTRHHHHRLKHTTWKSPHFSSSVSESDIKKNSFSRKSVPAVMISRFSKENLHDDDPVHETIDECEERGIGVREEEEAAEKKSEGSGREGARRESDASPERKSFMRKFRSQSSELIKDTPSLSSSSSSSKQRSHSTHHSPPSFQSTPSTVHSKRH